MILVEEIKKKIQNRRYRIPPNREIIFAVFISLILAKTESKKRRWVGVSPILKSTADQLAGSANHSTHQTAVVPTIDKFPSSHLSLPATRAYGAEVVTNLLLAPSASRGCWILVCDTVDNPQSYTCDDKRRQSPHRHRG